MPHFDENGVGLREVTQLAALNETLRDDYAEDCQKGLDRWNRATADAGVDVTFTLPHAGFHRQVGTFRDAYISPTGQSISKSEWSGNVGRWLPTDADRAYVKSLMVGVTKLGEMAGWVAPPSRGIHQKPVEYDYVQL